MGQRVVVHETAVVDDAVIIATDRSFTGMEGVAYEAAPEPGSDFVDVLAERIFSSDEFVRHVYVSMNTIVTVRDGGWDEEGVARIAGIVEELYLFYPDAE